MFPRRSKVEPCIEMSQPFCRSLDVQMVLIMLGTIIPLWNRCEKPLNSPEIS